MDLAATSSSAPAVASPAIEKAREKQRRRICEAITGLKPEDQIEFLISRLAESDVSTGEQKKELEQTKRENGKLNLKLDSVQKMLSKAELSKSKLEQLCRELSKAQREEKEANQMRLKHIQATHADTVESFKKSLADIQHSVESKQEHSKRVADVERLSTNLNQMAADYETRLNDIKKLYDERDADLAKIASAKDKELGLMRVQIEEMQKRVSEVFSENVQLKKQSLNDETRLKESVEAELKTRQLLDEYAHKYAALTESLSSTNGSFDNLKEQMSKMNGTMIKVQGDAKKWREQAEAANKLATSLSLAKVESDNLLAFKNRQLAQLQELCRRLNKENRGIDKNSMSSNDNEIGEKGKEENEEGASTSNGAEEGEGGEEGKIEEKVAQIDLKEEIKEEKKE
ncbi:unnamed protein product [Meloidogyne enterolobii]|uniref:Uncharacterized protein n=2 Tax=Meloidogyne enterolobii TaxID=390850 RepID=A0ACB1AG75_MELEN|nr:unnamed protein product [Meloidogyne enterolobii]